MGKEHYKKLKCESVSLMMPTCDISGYGLKEVNLIKRIKQIQNIIEKETSGIVSTDLGSGLLISQSHSANKIQLRA